MSELMVIESRSSPLHTLEFKVEGRSIDENGHVNNVEVIRWMQDAAVAHAEASGAMAATRAAGAIWVVRSHHVEYFRPVLEGESVVIRTWVATMGRTRSLRKYLLSVGADLVARGETLWVFVDASSGRPRGIVPEVVAALPLLPVADEPTPNP